MEIEPSNISSSSFGWQRALTKGSPPPPIGGHASWMGSTNSSSGTQNPTHMFIFGGSTYAPSDPKDRDASANLGLTVSDELWLLDWAQLQWMKLTPKGTTPTPRYAHSATALHNNSEWSGRFVVVFGGFNGTNYLDDFHLFDISRLTWHGIESRGTIPSARYAHSAVNVPTEVAEDILRHCNREASSGSVLGYVLIFGGCGVSSVHHDLHIAKIVRSTHGVTAYWSEIKLAGTLPPPRAYHCNVLLPPSQNSHNSQLLIFGGRAGHRYYNDLWTLDLGSLGENPNSQGSTWKKMNGQGDVPSPRAYHSLVPIGNPHSLKRESSRLILFGGMDGVRSYNETYVLDVDEISWKLLPATSLHPSNRHKQIGSWLRPGKIVIFGGMDAPPSGFNDVYIFTFPENSTSNLNSTFNLNSTSQPIPVPEQQLGKRSSKSEMHHEKNSQLESQVEIKLKTEIEFLRNRNSFLAGNSISQDSTWDELEELEKIYLEGLSKISIFRREKLNFILKENSQLENGTPSKEISENLQSSVTNLQAENLKLRRKLKDLGGDSMEVQKANSVGFSTVNTRTFLPQQGQGVPSGGSVAPLGMDMITYREHSEPINTFEFRREAERRGVNRVPEDQRIFILKSRGITDEELASEAQSLREINWSRLQSIGSPTENPLPEQQREMYRRLL
eukprot:TRINITY_DN2472_c0_g3_i1.p1 TRINITY_DN2472_c0_g3~~TRINITY_DN2472_c0_g3_i1.p1  ORF type:complete len:672 (-),score=204.25 TRINITY_DN2472_c0_g3_i1:24-2039(-)